MSSIALDYSSYLTYLLCGYLTIVNLIAFAMMGIDKSRARRGAWRISEKALFLSALLGGSIGAIWGMQHFRHKTKHWYFKYGMPAILIVQLAAVLYIMFHALPFAPLNISGIFVLPL